MTGRVATAVAVGALALPLISTVAAVTGAETPWAGAADPAPASISVTNTPNPTTVSAANQTVGYTFAITNSGPFTLTQVGVADIETKPSANRNLSTITCAAGTNGSLTLAPGATTSCSATDTVNQADFDNGKIVNTVTASGTAPGGGIASGTATASITAIPKNAEPDAKITLTKSASVASVSAPTNVIYTFTAKNDGKVDLTNVDITDHANFSPLSGLTCANGETNGSISLAPGDAEVCNATFHVSQDWIDFGQNFVDTGSVSANAPASDTTQPTVSATSNQVTVKIVANPKMTLTKTASAPLVSAAGQTVTYNFAVTNVGNVTLDNIAINDVLTAPSSASGLSPIHCPFVVLAVGGSENCTATYTVSQADMDNGKITDTATASITYGDTKVTSNGSSVTIPATQNPSLVLTKSADTTEVSQVGQEVTYSFLVKNTGNVTVNALAIDDQQSAPSLNSGLSGFRCPQVSLAPGASETCTDTYSVSQKDLIHGSITDTATAAGQTQLKARVTSNSSSATVEAVQMLMSGRAYAIGADIMQSGRAEVGPLTVNDTGGVETAVQTITPTPCVAAAGVKDLSIRGDVCAGVETTTGPNTSSATSSVANLGVNAFALDFTTQAVRSTSTTSCRGSTGSVTIASLKVAGTTVISKPTVIAPNTVVDSGDQLHLVLNEQLPFNNGGETGLTVNAIHIQFHAAGQAYIDMVVASSTSDVQCAVPAQLPVLTGEANDVDLLPAAFGNHVGANVVVHDTSPVVTNQATSTVPPCVAAAQAALVTLTGNACATVTTLPNGIEPASSTANASVGNLVTAIPSVPVITVRGVTTTSTTSCTASSGSMQIAYLSIGSTVVFNAVTDVAPNTKIVVGDVTLILNQQISFNGADTGLTVHAIAIGVNTVGPAGPLKALGTIASSTSDIFDC